MESCKAVDKEIDKLLKKLNEFEGQCGETIDDSLERLSQLRKELNAGTGLNVS